MVLVVFCLYLTTVVCRNFRSDHLFTLMSIGSFYNALLCSVYVYVNV